MNGGPGNDAKMPIKSPFWIGIKSTSGILFFKKFWTYPEGLRDGPLMQSPLRLTFFPVQVFL